MANCQRMEWIEFLLFTIWPRNTPLILEKNDNEKNRVFRPQFSTVRLYLAGDNLGQSMSLLQDRSPGLLTSSPTLLLYRGCTAAKRLIIPDHRLVYNFILVWNTNTWRVSISCNGVFVEWFYMLFIIQFSLKHTSGNNKGIWHEKEW